MLTLAQPHQPRYHANFGINRLGMDSPPPVVKTTLPGIICKMQHLARTDRVYMENVGDGGKERVQEMSKNEEIQKATENLKRIKCERDEREAVTGADAMILGKDSLDSRGMLKLDQSLKVEAWNVDIRPEVGSELDRMKEAEMLKLEHNLDVHQKIAARRNLSFRSKKQQKKAQSIDSSGISGTELEKERSQF